VQLRHPVRARPLEADDGDDVAVERAGPGGGVERLLALEDGAGARSRGAAASPPSLDHRAAEVAPRRRIPPSVENGADRGGEHGGIAAFRAASRQAALPSARTLVA